MLPEVAAGDPEPQGESFVVYGFGGASARLNGATVSGSGGFVPATQPDYTLDVGGVQISVEVGALEPPLFSNGFESGDLGSWSAVVQ